MWLCRPTSRKLSAAKTRRTASIAAPPASEKPNFWSSCAVEMNSWVCASTPDGQSDQHVLNDTGLTGDTIESVDLDRRVEHDVSDARGDTSGQFGD